MQESPLFHELNDKQKEAAKHRDGPLVVFAGAGSGKTRVITTRIAYLISKGVAPWNILAVTFTNKAAGEMKERLLQLTPDGRGCLVSTFHSACARWLREFAAELGFSGDFVIYDDSDVNAALKALLKTMGGGNDLMSLLPEYKSFLHMAKTNALFPHDIEQMQQQMSHLIPDGGLKLYRAYQEFLAKCNAMDFNDLLLNMLLLLRRNKQVKSILQQRYKYVLVDEYQDTNRTQFELIEHIVESHRNLFVVGDDDQSIYSWRGATPANIIDFERHYPDAKRIVMEENYRSTSTIVDAAAHMIAKNKKRAEKKAFTSNPSGELIDVHVESDSEMEAWWITKSIEEERHQFSPDDIAIFYRTNSQSRLIEDSLRRENIPYRIFGSVKFYDRLEVKDLMAYIRLVLNEDDDVALRRVINVPPRGIGAKAVDQVQVEAAKLGCSMLQACQKMAAENTPRIGPKLGAFARLIRNMRGHLLECDLAEVVDHIIDTVDYGTYLEKKFPDQHIDKWENIHELGNALAEFHRRNPDTNLAEWLQSVTLVREEGEEVTTGVSLMTLHMAKGLEYPRVYLTGCEEALLPHRNSLDDQDAIEEERRLFYVGMTRAREKLTLTFAQRRTNYGQTVCNQPSRFLGEIPAKFMRSAMTGQPVSFEIGGADLQVHEDGVTYDYGDTGGAVSQVSKGAMVYHDAYGKGVVESIESVFGEIKATVDFNDFGMRKVAIRQLRQVESRF